MEENETILPSCRSKIVYERFQLLSLKIYRNSCCSDRCFTSISFNVRQYLSIGYNGSNM